MSLSGNSLKKLEGVHSDLLAVVMEVSQVSSIPFIVTEGLRSPIRQAQLVKQGASKTTNSRHLDGHAIDIAAMIDTDKDGTFEVCWKWHLYEALAQTFKTVAAELLGPGRLEWGGDWKTFKDGAHFQLSWDHYPSGKLIQKKDTPISA